MKEFSSVTAMIKNSDGVYEGIPALRGVDSYELAVKNGYTGTEEEWLESIIGDGWIGAYQELDAKTDEINDEIDGLKQLVDDAKDYQVPWNVDDNVGQINIIDDYYVSTDIPPNSSGTASFTVKMINSGDLYLRFGGTILNGQDTPNAIIFINDVESISTTTSLNGTSAYVSDLIRLSVSKNDVVTIQTTFINPGSSTISNTINNVMLFANIETSYKYYDLNGGTQIELPNASSSVLDVLLGVTE